MKLTPLFLTLFLLTSCTGSKESSSISTSGASDSSTSLPVRWPFSKIPLDVKISTAFNSSTIDSYDSTSGDDTIQQMMKKWNNVYDAGTFFNYSAGQVANYAPADVDSYNDSTIGIYLLGTWPSDFKYNALAVTQYWAQEVFYPTGNILEIVHGDILVNDQYYAYTADATDLTYRYDFPTVILHELGHLIGLKHIPSSLGPSIMEATLGEDEVKRSIYTIDSKNINSLYDDGAFTVENPTLGKFSKGTQTPAPRGKIYRGVIELMPNGKCLHYLDGKLIEEHSN